MFRRTFTFRSRVNVPERIKLSCSQSSGHLTNPQAKPGDLSLDASFSAEILRYLYYPNTPRHPHLWHYYHTDWP